MKASKNIIKSILLALAGLKMCTGKENGSKALCSDRETNIGQLIQK